MPLTAKGKKVLSSMQSEYGTKKGKSVFYASINKGKLKGAEAGGKARSGIHIKKSHEGRLTAKAKAAGEGVQEYAHKHLHDKNEATRKQAQFAVNAKKFHHGSGGKVRRGIPAGGTPGTMDPIAAIGLGNSGGAMYGGKVSSHPMAHAKSKGGGRW